MVFDCLGRSYANKERSLSYGWVGGPHDYGVCSSIIRTLDLCFRPDMDLIWDLGIGLGLDHSFRCSYEGVSCTTAQRC